MSPTPIQSPDVLQAAREFSRRAALGWALQSALLFGSQARGMAHLGSDTDVAVPLKGAAGDFVATKLALDVLCLLAKPTSLP